MTSNHSTSMENFETESSSWAWLYRMGGIGAITMAVLIPIQIVVFIAWPPPQTVIEYFTLFQQNRVLGVLDLDFLLIVDNLVSIPLYLAFYVVLQRKNKSFMLIGTALGILSIILYLVSREATFSMLTLSNLYAAATSDAQRQVFLAAGQVMFISYNGTVFNISYILGAVALIVISIIMLQSHYFSKWVGYLGLVANVIAFGLYVPVIGVYISIFSVLFLWIWDILVAARLLQLGNLPAAKRPE